MFTGVTSKDVVLEAVRAVSSVYTIPDNIKYTYGTAGFRCKADILAPAAFRMGLLCALRAKCVGACIGVVVTASHNPPEDNGLKIVEPQGEILVEEWEGYATKLSNTLSASLVEVLVQLADKLQLSLTSTRGRIMIARDTRDSGPELVKAFSAGAACLECQIHDVGVCTTPQLHWLVKQTNVNKPDTMVDYYATFADSFARLYSSSSVVPEIKVDCANGVGAEALAIMSDQLSDLISIRLFNVGTSGRLNENCGADFVKLMQNAPQGIAYTEDEHCYSIDGDADRVVFFFKDKHQFKLLDGDKIACLFATFIKTLLEEADLTLTMGVVQTAYANGSSTTFLKGQHIPTICVPTGVKYLHKKAEGFDIGVYFEANGHGTILFSDDAVDSIMQKAGKETRRVPKAALDKLLSFSRLINPAVGDAVCNILAIEAILKQLKFTPTDWNAMYTDLPYRQLKINIRDRSLIKTIDAERKVVEPVGMQEKIDVFVAKYKGARCFVRPSGTENCVRVLAECGTQPEAEELAISVGSMVFDFTENLYSNISAEL